jgi:hypothetical protein
MRQQSGATFLLGSLLFSTLGATAVADAAPTLVVHEGETYEHRILPEPFVLTPWTNITENETTYHWDFDLTIDTQGSVVTATLKSGSDQLRDEALRAVRTARFKPFRRSGHAIPVRLTYTIGSRTEDYSGPEDRAFPDNPPPEPTKITLLRSSGCLGVCPGYRVEIRGSGAVTYEGKRNVVVKGTYHWQIDPRAVTGLLDQFRRAKYFKLKGYYELGVSDDPVYVTSLSIGAQRKFVLEEGARVRDLFAASGEQLPEIPPVTAQLEDAIDRVSGVLSWVNGDDNTMAHLRAIGWNFASAEVGDALNLLVGNCNTPLARQFILAGTPAVSSEGPGMAIGSAARCGDMELVRLMESRGALAREEDVQVLLEAGAESGLPDIVGLALEHGGRATTKDESGKPLLSVAAASYMSDEDPRKASFDSARVVQLLVAAGADPSARDKEGNTPLFEALRAEVARALIKAGADASARNTKGETPMFNRYIDGQTVQVLLEAGADINARDNYGRTALFYQDTIQSIKTLVHAGADVNAKDAEGHTPLEAAREEWAVLTLIDVGAKLPADPEGLAALMQRATNHRWSKLLRRLKNAAVTAPRT